MDTAQDAESSAEKAVSQADEDAPARPEKGDDDFPRLPRTYDGPRSYHGNQRSSDSSRLDPYQQAEVLDNYTDEYTARNGTRVYVQDTGGRYNVVVMGRKGLVTTYKSLTRKQFQNAARNYGWRKVL